MTLESLVSRLFKVFDFFGEDIDPSLIDSDEIFRYIKYFQAEKASGATINRHLDAISNIYKYGLTIQEFRKMPVKNPVIRLVHQQKENPPRQRYWFMEERMRFLRACDNMGSEFFFPTELLKRFAVVSWTCAPRIAELLQLQVHQVKLAEELFVLEGWQTKNRKKRYVKMHIPDVTAIFKELIRGKEAQDFVFSWPGCKKRLNKDKGDCVEYDSLAHAFQQVCEASGMKGVKIHDWRKTAAIDWAAGMYAEPMDLSDVRDELQHSDSKTTDRYVDESLVRQLRDIKKKRSDVVWTYQY